MDDRDRNLLKELLAHQRVLSLAVLVEGAGPMRGSCRSPSSPTSPPP